ncbi:MAG: hypothetical protein E6R04_10255 [Spirochaetes bacterium]|nr:MAG: hypothetical protein E6R04_10255 [Spirochaetota bacterium]
MAYDTFDPAEIAAGQPVKQELWQKVSDNFVDHESRLSDVESGSGLTAPPFEFAVLGAHWLLGAAQTAVATMRAPYALTLTDVKLFIVDAGSAGTLQIDIQKKSGGGAFGTVFSTKPSSVYTDGALYTSTNAALSVTSVANGDFLRLDLTTVMTDCDEFYVYIYHTVG